jgi:hypothetical protein
LIFNGLAITLPHIVRAWGKIGPNLVQHLRALGHFLSHGSGVFHQHMTANRDDPAICGNGPLKGALG